jgi:hypothetical protein
VFVQASAAAGDANSVAVHTWYLFFANSWIAMKRTRLWLGLVQQSHGWGKRVHAEGVLLIGQVTDSVL